MALCFYPAALGHLLQVVGTGKTKHLWQCIPGGAETVETTSRYSRMGPVPTTALAKWGYPCCTILSSWLRTIWQCFQVQVSLVFSSSSLCAVSSMSGPQVRWYSIWFRHGVFPQGFPLGAYLPLGLYLESCSTLETREEITHRDLWEMNYFMCLIIIITLSPGPFTLARHLAQCT